MALIAPQARLFLFAADPIPGFAVVALIAVLAIGLRVAMGRPIISGPLGRAIRRRRIRIWRWYL